MNDDTETIRRRLLELRQQLTREAREQAPETVEDDRSRVGRLSRMDAIQGRAMAQATAERRSLRLRQVDAALERLDQGEYGICRHCETAIDPRRLDADPLATLCVRCASRAET